MRLYEIDQAIENCVDMETGEVIDMDKLSSLQMERDAKIENVVCWIKDLKAEAEAIKAEKKALNERQQAAENKAESLKSWLAYALDGQKFKTAKASVSFRKTQSVEVMDLNALIEFDDNLVKYKEPEPDKNAIKAMLKDGKNVAGCTLKDNISTIIK